MVYVLTTKSFPTAFPEASKRLENTPFPLPSPGLFQTTTKPPAGDTLTEGKRWTPVV